jgi:tetratricopeptide (TPR) repeat protein
MQTQSAYSHRIAIKSGGYILVPMVIAVSGLLIAGCGSILQNGYLGYETSGHTKQLSGKTSEAIADYTKAINLAEKDPDERLSGLYSERGECYSLAKQYQNGVDDQSKAIALVKSGKADGMTVNDLTKEDSLKVLIARYYDLRADDYKSLKDYKHSFEDFDTAIAGNPIPWDQAVYLQHRGSAYKSLGQYQKAIDDYTAATKLDAGNVMNYQLRADSYEKIGKKDLAQKDRVKIKELGP